MIYKDKVAFFASYISDMEYKGIKAKTLETVDFTRLQGITTVFLIMYRYIQKLKCVQIEITCTTEQKSHFSLILRRL